MLKKHVRKGKISRKKVYMEWEGRWRRMYVTKMSEEGREKRRGRYGLKRRKREGGRD